MRILFVHNVSDLYGASRCLLRLASQFSHDGAAVEVVLPEDGPLKKELEQKGIAVSLHRRLSLIDRQKIRNLLGLLQFFVNFPISVFKLCLTIRRFKPDIIHTNTAVIVSPGVAAALARVPHVWHIREFFSEFPSVWRIYQWFVYLFADAIVCMSNPVAAQFSGLIQRNKVSVIHDGLPQSEFTKPEESRVRNFKTKFELNGHLVAGVVGRIKFKRKGQEVFVKAAAILKEKYPDARFICVGSPFPGNEEHLKMLLQLVDVCGLKEQFVYTGDVDDIQAAYEALDVLVMSSVLPEPFGNVTVEAMAMGKPVVGTNIGGTVELIADNMTGLLVKPGDPESMARALDRLFSDGSLRQTFGAAGRQRFLNDFELSAFYKKIQDLYRILLGKSDRQSAGNVSEQYP